VFTLKLADKKIGLGSLSLLLCIMGILFGFQFGTNRVCYGDKVLAFLGLPAWSNGSDGVHYGLFYSLAFFIPSIILGFKYHEHWGTMLSRIIGVIVLIFMVLILIFSFMP
jgi:membrane-associated HD superfamily phosphohydrolase